MMPRGYPKSKSIQIEQELKMDDSKINTRVGNTQNLEVGHKNV
jgi:hypothetical protein